MPAMITGSLVAIVTPMHEDGRLDLGGFRKLIDWHVAEGTDGIVVVGTTGESPTVDFDEHKELIRLAVQHSRGRIPVIAGTGGNSTAEAIDLTESAKKAGATACLSVVPYYNKPTQEGQYRHFRKIAETVDLPLILYNVPARTVADLQNDTVMRLAQVPRIIGIKDATANRQRGAEAHAADVRGSARRRREEGARAQPAPAAAAPAAVRRGKPDPGQVGARRDGHDRIRPAAAAVDARREVPPDAARGAARGGHRAAGAARRGGPRLMKKIAVAGVGAPLAGCGTSFFDSKVDYKSAGTLPNLEVPPDLTAPARDTRFVVPETGKSSATLSGYQTERKEQARSGNTAVLPQGERMHIQRARAERLLVVADHVPHTALPP